MTTGHANQLTKQVGEFLVAAELARQGWLGAMLSGNTPDFDLVATDIKGRSVPVQVKAITGSSWQFDVSRFAEITYSGKSQLIGKLKPYPRNLVCVLVALSRNGRTDDFFVLPVQSLQKLIIRHHAKYLAKHGGIRPKNPKSTHSALQVTQVERYRGKWDVVAIAAR